MKVAELSDGKAIQPRRPPPKEDILADDARTVGLKEYGLGSQHPNASGGCETDKFSSGRRKTCGRRKRQSLSGPYTAELLLKQSLFQDT